MAFKLDGSTFMKNFAMRRARTTVNGWLVKQGQKATDYLANVLPAVIAQRKNINDPSILGVLMKDEATYQKLLASLAVIKPYEALFSDEDVLSFFPDSYVNYIEQIPGGREWVLAQIQIIRDIIRRL